MMGMGVGVGFSRKQMSSAPPSLSDQVQAILAGKVGFAADPSDPSTLWQDTAATVPITAPGQAVARWDAKWSNIPRNMTQATASVCPSWDGTGILFDGTDDRLETGNANLGDMLNNVPGFFSCARYKIDAFGASRSLFNYGFPGNNQASKLTFSLPGSPELRVVCLRLDTDTATTITTSGAGLVAGQPFVMSFEIDFAGTGLCRIWVNGVLRASAAIAGVAGNTSATGGNRYREGSSVSNTPGGFWSGWRRRRVDIAQTLSDADRATIEAWVGEV